MNANCSPFCETCLLLDYDHRCPSLDHQEKSPLNAVSQPGDLNKLFERIVHDKGFKKLYQPQVLSRPMLLSSGSSNNDDNSSSSSILPDGPWIVVLDNFLTDEECQSVIQHGTEKGYQVSTSLRNGLYVATLLLCTIVCRSFVGFLSAMSLHVYTHSLSSYNVTQRTSKTGQYHAHLDQYMVRYGLFDG
jgi:hypothetical protein